MRKKVRTPFSYILMIAFFCIVALFLSLLIGIIDITTDVFVYLRAAIIGWIILIVLALIGAIFVGMFLSHRILSIGGFTPFEEEMIEMREDIKTINKKLDRLIELNNNEDEPD